MRKGRNYGPFFALKWENVEIFNPRKDIFGLFYVQLVQIVDLFGALPAKFGPFYAKKIPQNLDISTR